MAVNRGGRPALYSEPSKMQQAVEAYFEFCAGKTVFDKNGRPITVDAHPPTITGLALALGFSSRKGLFDYQRKPMFRDIVDTAKLRVEQYAEESLFDSERVNGAKTYLLSCFHWGGEAKKENSKVTATQVRIIYKSTDTEELP